MKIKLDTLDEFKKLIDKKVWVLKNLETESFLGTVKDVKENPIDGIMISVTDRENKIYTIGTEYIIFPLSIEELSQNEDLEYEDYWGVVSVILEENTKSKEFKKLRDKALELYEEQRILEEQLNSLKNKQKRLEAEMDSLLIGDLSSVHDIDENDVIINCVKVFDNYITSPINGSIYIKSNDASYSFKSLSQMNVDTFKDILKLATVEEKEVITKVLSTMAVNTPYAVIKDEVN